MGQFCTSAPGQFAASLNTKTFAAALRFATETQERLQAAKSLSESLICLHAQPSGRWKTGLNPALCYIGSWAQRRNRSASP